MTKNEAISKAEITKFLYENAMNLKARQIFPASADEKIVLKNKLPKVNFFNFGFAPETRDWSIRVRFIGSDKWYEVKIGLEDVDDWFRFFKEQTKHEKKSMFGGTDEESEEW